MKSIFRHSFLYITALLGVIIFYSCKPIEEKGIKKIIILAGPKSHPACMHEYIKSARLIKVMLDHSANVKGLKTEIAYNGWPENESVLDSANLILTLSDGRDGPNGQDVPFFTDERMKVIEKQAMRGCGLMNIHYSTFAPDKYREKILDWVGGYFDWQNASGEREWYSDIRYADDTVTLLNVNHDVMRGVTPFKILEEYYFKLRFRENDTRLTPLIQVQGLGTEQPAGGVVAWAINRQDGGRGFGTTLGHFYSNWKIENYRKFLLNAIIWTSGAEVPATGVQSEFYPEPQITEMLSGASYKALILTGNNHPMHLWKETTPVLKKAVEAGGTISVDVSVNIHDLSQYDLRDYDVLIFNYCNWEDPNPLWDADKQALLSYVQNGGGLMFIHFANGAFHFSLPKGEASEWPEYRNLCRRVWNHKGASSHDPLGDFTVNLTGPENEITRGIHSFPTRDELYFKQEGDQEIHIILNAESKITKQSEPMAWTYEIPGVTGKTARVFQTVLGHDANSLTGPEIETILNRAALWTSRGTQYWNDL